MKSCVYKTILSIIITTVVLFNAPLCPAQYKVIKGIPSQVDFSKTLREWDGFGFNYVEIAQTDDPVNKPQEYGGFSLLDEQEKKEIIDLVFGENGLQVSLLKMFLDPWHQGEPGGPFDHVSTTQNMLDFAIAGNKAAQQRKGDLAIITTLYGPPAWATQQKFLQGRDLDPKMKMALAEYMIDWVRFLKKENGLPVKYLSLHNEGEDWIRWAWDGTKKGIFDYNMYWPNEQVNDFLKFMPDLLKKAGLSDVGVTNGEPSNWYRFSTWGIAEALHDDDATLNNLSIITSHGFYGGLEMKRWFADHRSAGTDLIREKKPGLHAWVTSTGWGKMDAMFIREIHSNIYSAKVNAIIPWAGIQRPTQWEGGDPNAGSAINVNEDGSYEVRKGYYFYKQVSRAGQPGMAVARTSAADTKASIIGFASNGTSHPDAFILINWDTEWDKIFDLQVKGTQATRFHAFRTDNDSENYIDLGLYELDNGNLLYNAPINSVTTFYATE